jgi:hypothetical protein
MGSITFRCGVCTAPLKARADKAGHKVCCKRCGALTSAAPGALPEPAAVAAEQAEQEAGGVYKVLSPAEPIAAPRRARPDRQAERERSLLLRSIPGWRRVRLGLFLIGLSLCVGVVCSPFAAVVYGGWGLLLQLLPITGYLLCAFVPLKGAARKLAVTNLWIIAVGLTLTLLALQTPLGFWGLSAWIRESMLQWFLLQWCMQIVVLSYFVRSIARELSKTIDAPSWLEGFLERMAFGPLDKPVGWLLDAVACGLGEKDLVAASPRVAVAALLTVTVVLIGQVAPKPAKPDLLSLEMWVLLFWIHGILGMITWVWQELILIETCFVIGKHLKPKPTEQAS